MSFRTFSRTRITKINAVALLTVDLQIQGHALYILCDFPCLRLCLFCQRDLGVYFHIIEVQDHSNDIIL